MPFIIRNLLFSIIFIALLAVSGFIVIPVGDTAYFTFQSMFVMLAGGILGARWGTFSVLIWILLAAAGIPVLGGGVSGIDIFNSPMTGYIVGYLFAAFLIGCLTRIIKISWITLLLIYIFGGIVIINAISICWFLFVVGVSLDVEIFFQSFVSFLPFDLVKVILATIVTVFVYRTLPALSLRVRK
jgi:biotin transport system substrate-specific component